MENKKQQQIDEIFKNELEGNTSSPSFENWENIASELEGDSIDGFVKNHLEEIQPNPHPKIWNGIKRKLPLSLLLRNQLNWLSRIAAVLVIFMVTVVVWNKGDNVMAVESKKMIAQEVVPMPDLVQPKEPVDFVFAINENANQNSISASEELFLEDDKTNEDLWTDLMDEEEDRMSDFNDDIIDKSLEEILELPFENIEAVIPDYENQFSIDFLENDYSFDKK